jgi:hypothetical protein
MIQRKTNNDAVLNMRNCVIINEMKIVFDLYQETLPYSIGKPYFEALQKS